MVKFDQLDGAEVGSADCGLGCGKIDLSVVVGGNDLDPNAQSAGELVVENEIRAVLSLGLEDAVAEVECSRR